MKGIWGVFTRWKLSKRLGWRRNMTGCGKKGGNDYCCCPHGKCRINVINANLIRLCHKQHTNLSRPDLKESHCKVSWQRTEVQKRERGREMASAISLMAPGCRHLCLAVGTRHGLPAPTATQIYDCMINGDFILPSATLQSAFPISKGAAMTGRATMKSLPIWYIWYKPELSQALVDLLD